MTVPRTFPPDIEQLRADILRAVRKVCPQWLANQADDLAQIATSRVVDRLRATDGTVEFSQGYLYRTAYSVVIDEIRRRRRRREVPIEAELSVESEQANPERQAIGRELRDAIGRCLSAIVPSRRRAVTLHLVGHTVAEISALLECGLKQAENLVYRGLGELRECLKARGVQS